MTKEELGQYKALKMEINMLHKRILKIKADQKGAEHNICQPARFPAHSNLIQEERTIRKSELLKDVIEKKKEECEKQLLEIQLYINEIPDSKLRVIFTHRYVDGLSWQAVAFRIGEVDESYPRRKHDKYLKAAGNA